MREIKYKGKYLELTEEVIDGHTYERVSLREGVRVYPVMGDKILIINELRKHEGVSRWKFIGGWVDKEEKEKLTIAKEELLEEVGMESEEWQEFHIFDTTNSTVSMVSTQYIAKNPVVVADPPKNPDNDIINEIKWITLSELWEMIDQKKLWWDYDAFAAVQVLRSIR